MGGISIFSAIFLLYVLSSYCNAAEASCQLCLPNKRHTLIPAPQPNTELKNIKHLTIEQLKKLTENQDLLIVDGRSFSQMTKGVIKNSIWVGYFTNATWNDWFRKNVKDQKKIVLYGNQEQLTPIFSILMRIGKKNIVGRVDFEISDWKGKKMPCQQPQYIDEIQPGMVILDVRSPFQWKQGVVKGAKLIQLKDIINQVDKLDKNKTHVLVCRTGCRANIAMRILKPFGLKLRVFNHPFEHIFKSKWCEKAQV